MNRHDKFVSTLALVIALQSGAAVAQTARNEPDQTSTQAEQVSPTGIEDIVVTAQKSRRGEAAQTVPIAISAFGGAAIEARNIQNLQQLGYSTPNARLQQVGIAPGYANFAFRGIGFNSSTPSDEPTVVTVLDGMVIGTAAGAILETFDLESVEVLRGPQGVLFGKNSTGGAVSLRSRRPDGEQDLRATLTLGSYNRYGASVAFEPELNSDVISARIAATYNHQGGYFKNLTVPGDRGGASETYTIRPTVKLDVTNTLKFTLIGQLSHYDGDSSNTRMRTTNTIATTLYGFGLCPGKHTVCQDSPSESNWTSKHLIGELTLDVGPGTLTSITAYRDYDLFSNGNDVDGSPAPAFNISPLTFDQSQFSEELRYAGSLLDDRLNFTVGGYYFTQEYTFTERRYVGRGPGLSLAVLTGKAHQRETQKAVFGQLRFKILPNLGLIGGLRYTDQVKKAQIVPLGANACANFPDCPFTFSGRYTSSNLGPKAGFEWTPAKDILIYGSYTRGFRAGGFNLRTPAPTIPKPYSDEKVDAFELGAKTEWLDRRLRLNVSVFDNKFDDLQRQNVVPSALGIQTLVVNAAAARIRGAELEAIFLPIDGLRLDAAVGYINARYLSFNGVDLTGDGVPDPELAKKLRLERAPKWSYSFGVSYTAPLGEARELRLSANYSYTADTASNTTNLSVLPAIKLLDADVALKLNDHVEIAVFGKNLTDEIYGELSSYAVPTFNNLYLSPPRTFGAQLRLTY